MSAQTQAQLHAKFLPAMTANMRTNDELHMQSFASATSELTNIVVTNPH